MRYDSIILRSRKWGLGALIHTIRDAGWIQTYGR
jgi:hypothetical protein